MLFWCWASVADSDTTLSQQRYKSMCVGLLGTLNAIPFDKQIYIYLKVQKLRGDLWNLKFEGRSLKFQLRIAAKKLIREIPINLSW